MLASGNFAATYSVGLAHNPFRCGFPFLLYMPSSTHPPLRPNFSAVLLVLLPTVSLTPQQAPPVAGAATKLLLANLQLELGGAIRILKVDEATHPGVVRAFGSQGLPAFVLLRDGEELWRQQGLPEGESMAALLLSKLLPPASADETSPPSAEMMPTPSPKE
jgi:hypothetical protein